MSLSHSDMLGAVLGVTGSVVESISENALRRTYAHSKLNTLHVSNLSAANGGARSRGLILRPSACLAWCVCVCVFVCLCVCPVSVLSLLSCPVYLSTSESITAVPTLVLAVVCQSVRLSVRLSRRVCVGVWARSASRRLSGGSWLIVPPAC